MSPDDLRRYFPRISESTLRANADPAARTGPTTRGRRTLAAIVTDDLAAPTPPPETIHASLPHPKPVFTLTPSTDEQKLNRTEKSWLAVLRSRNVHWIGVQAVTLKLGDDCRYTPDFEVIDQAGLYTFYETKGFMRDDALAKLKTAARAFPWAKFVIVTREDGAWVETPVKP